jgi:hypothetical protein
MALTLRSQLPEVIVATDLEAATTVALAVGDARD